MNNENSESKWRLKPEEERQGILEIHKQALREMPEPEEGLERPPWWLWAVTVLLIFWAGFYLGRYGGVFGSSVHVLEREGQTAEMTEISKTPRKEEIEVDGSAVYARICAACHQQNGQGVPGAFPPLAGSEWVKGDPLIPILIVLNGLAGSIEVKGVTYNNIMPAWGSQLSSEEIAGVLTYVRNSWGNEVEEIAPILVEQVRKENQTRTTAWTADELKHVQ